LRRLWYLFVFILATMIGPARVRREPSSRTHRIRSGWSSSIRSPVGTTGYRRACAWAFGNDSPGHTVHGFGQINRYGPLLRLTYLLFGGLGVTTGRCNDFRHIIRGNSGTASVVGRT
jgi:hypothetical protein